MKNQNPAGLSQFIADLIAALANLENIGAPIHKAASQADNMRGLEVVHSDGGSRATDGRHTVAITPRKNTFTFSTYKEAA